MSGFILVITKTIYKTRSAFLIETAYLAILKYLALSSMGTLSNSQAQTSCILVPLS